MTLATLYAYISRGQLQSEPVPGRPRERRYYREDIERLRERKETRRDPARAAARGLHCGSPVLSSSITLIHHGKPYYRGRDAVKLAEKATLEQVAELLWAAEGSEGERLFEQPCVLSPRQLARLGGLREGPIGSASNGIAAGRGGGSGIVRFTSRGRPPDRSAHRSIVDNYSRKTRFAGSCSPDTTNRMGAGEGGGWRGDSHGAGRLRGPRTECLGVYRQVRGVGGRLAL